MKMCSVKSTPRQKSQQKKEEHMERYYYNTEITRNQDKKKANIYTKQSIQVGDEKLNNVL